jgi:antitoxin (DNA-binding transcriptional repressor) of toxin-antitoxin stability system
MRTVISAGDARKRLGTLLDDVRLRGTTFVIERDGRPVA